MVQCFRSGFSSVVSRPPDTRKVASSILAGNKAVFSYLFFLSLFVSFFCVCLFSFSQNLTRLFSVLKFDSSLIYDWLCNVFVLRSSSLTSIRSVVTATIPLTSSLTWVKGEVKLPACLTVPLTSVEGIPHSRNYTGNVYKLLVQLFVGWFGWTSVTYDWWTVFRIVQQVA